MQAEGIAPTAVEVSIALVNDAEIRELNGQYRMKDTPTDVLSFPQDDLVAIPGQPRLLGDIVVSLETARRQAVMAAHPLAHEVGVLIIHGVLHLLGYDDVTVEGYEEMVRKGAAIGELVPPPPSRERSAHIRESNAQ